MQSGIFFKWADICFYKAVFYFRMGEFEKALKKMEKALVLKGYQEKNKLDEFEFDNNTFNIYEFYFNCAACYIMMQKYDDAIKKISQL